MTQPTTEQTTTAHTAVPASTHSNPETKPKAIPSALKKFHKSARRKEEKLKAALWLLLGFLTFCAIVLDQLEHFLEQLIRLVRELLTLLGL